MSEHTRDLTPKEKVLQEFPQATCSIKRYYDYGLWCVFLEPNSKVFTISFIDDDRAWQNAATLIDIINNVK